MSWLFLSPWFIIIIISKSFVPFAVLGGGHDLLLAGSVLGDLVDHGDAFLLEVFNLVGGEDLVLRRKYGRLELLLVECGLGR